MNKILLVAVFIIFVILFITDTAWSRKIWTAAVTVVSIVSVSRIPFVYPKAIDSINNSVLPHETKQQWIADYNRLFIIAVVFLIIYIFFMAVSYIYQHDSLQEQEIYSMREYVVLFLSAILAIVLHTIGVVFSVSHIVKGYDISYYAVAITSAVNTVIIASSMLYMKLSQ